MPQFPATAVLRAEHDNILAMIDVAESAARRLREGGAVEARLLSGLVEVFRLYADRRHHAKEEAFLFPALQRKGMPVDGGPIGVMLFEHDNGRAFVQEMADAACAYEGGEAGVAARWAAAARGFAQVLRAHIDKENNILFVLAERMLSAAEQDELAAAYAEVEAEHAATGEQARLEELMQSLRAAAVPA